MESYQKLSPLVKLTGSVLQSGKNADADLKKLINVLQQSHADLTETNFLKSEDALFQGDIKKSLLNKFPDLGIEGAREEPKKIYKVYRREVPILSGRVKGSMPEWAHGASPSFTLGPFIALDGRKFWFDFYFIIELVSLFRQGDPQPVALLTLIVPFFIHPATSYTVDPGSIWLRADLLAAGAGNQQYAALKVKGGTLKFSKEYAVSPARAITFDTTTIFDLDLDLDNSHTSPAVTVLRSGCAAV
jgi:hypothetical protein